MPSDLAQIQIKSYSLGIQRTEFTMTFPAYVTEFSDNYTSVWKSEQIYGKMDPIATFQNTSRKVTLGFDLPSANYGEALNNFKNVNTLAQGLYPVYNDDEKLGIATVGSPPFFRIRYANFLNNPQTTDGLLCYLDGGFNFTPDLTAGYFIDYENKTLNNGNPFFYPKLIKVSLSFTVIHEVPLGSKLKDDSISPRLIIKGNDKITNFPYTLPKDTTPAKIDPFTTGTGKLISATIANAEAKKIAGLKKDKK